MGESAEFDGDEAKILLVAEVGRRGGGSERDGEMAGERAGESAAERAGENAGEKDGDSSGDRAGGSTKLEAPGRMYWLTLMSCAGAGAGLGLAGGCTTTWGTACTACAATGTDLNRVAVTDCRRPAADVGAGVAGAWTRSLSAAGIGPAGAAAEAAVEALARALAVAFEGALAASTAEGVFS